MEEDISWGALVEPWGEATERGPSFGLRKIVHVPFSRSPSCISSLPFLDQIAQELNWPHCMEAVELGPQGPPRPFLTFVVLSLFHTEELRGGVHAEDPDLCWLWCVFLCLDSHLCALLSRWVSLK